VSKAIPAGDYVVSAKTVVRITGGEQARGSAVCLLTDRRGSSQQLDRSVWAGPLVPSEKLYYFAESTLPLDGVLATTEESVLAVVCHRLGMAGEESATASETEVTATQIGRLG
jgi:hypothetical protein